MVRAKCFVQMMSVDMLLEFEEEIRRLGYGQSAVVAEWLAARGVKSSKSAVARYELALRERDGISAPGGSLRAVVTAQGSSLDTLNGIYRRLGELDYEREMLIGMVRDKLAEQERKGAP